MKHFHLRQKNFRCCWSKQSYKRRTQIKTWLNSPSLFPLCTEAYVFGWISIAVLHVYENIRIWMALCCHVTCVWKHTYLDEPLLPCCMCTNYLNDLLTVVNFLIKFLFLPRLYDVLVKNMCLVLWTTLKFWRSERTGIIVFNKVKSFQTYFYWWKDDLK